jgi:L-lactate dehydrogenase
LGVHGDCQVVAWSSATINGIPLDKVLSSDGFGHDELAQECKERAENIFYAKGATPFGIGSVVASICASILFDKGDVRLISHFQPEFGCCFSLPVILGRRGIIKTIKMPLESDENAAIARSAQRLKSTMERIDKDH